MKKHIKIIFWVLLIVAGFMYCSGCSPAPCWCTKYVDTRTLITEQEEYLCSKYYADKENQLDTLLGSHDFFLEGEDKVTSSILYTQCPTCGIYYPHPAYGEHIKTCCP